MQNKTRYLELDCLRGIASIAVVLFHFTFGYDNGLKSFNANHIYFTYGRMGVQLFFLISGFVILMTLDNSKNIKDFVISRFSRLYPSYWCSILFTVIFISLFGAPFQLGKYTSSQICINFSMIQFLFKVKDVDGAY